MVTISDRTNGGTEQHKKHNALDDTVGWQRYKKSTHCRSLLDDFLVSSLDAAVSLKQVHIIAVLVSKYLYLNVPMQQSKQGHHCHQLEDVLQHPLPSS